MDAYCIGLAALSIENTEDPNFSNTYRIKQFRRQNRAVINHQTERSYYINKTKVATNRRPRFEQKGEALSDWCQRQVTEIGQAETDKLLSLLTVKKSTRFYNDKYRVMPGAVFYYQGERHILSGQLTGGRYLRAYGDTKTNYPASKCRIVKHNEGLVFI